MLSARAGTIVLTLALVCGRGASAHAQPPPTAATPVPPVSTEAAHPDTDYVAPVRTEPDRIPGTRFIMPDAPDDWKTKTGYDGRFVTTRLTVVALVDYTAFTQDADSVSQVGAQTSQWDVRSFRTIAGGQIKTPHPINYLISIEIKGQDHVTSGASQIGVTDWEIGTSLGRFGNSKYGKIKEPFAYEMVGDAANLQQQERILSPFFVSRGTGLRWGNTLAHDRMTLSAGWFNDWWIENARFTSRGNDFASRLTGVPVWSDAGANFVHLGISGRRSASDGGTFRFRGRPESNTASYYVDSGDVPATESREVGFEGLVGRGPFLVSSEYAHASVDAPAKNDPSFWGGYVTVSYILTGEHRPYDRKVGYTRRVLPEGRIGAWEVFGRYSHLDIDDQLVKGGIMEKGALGLNWWATRRWKIAFDYGLTDLNRAGVHGVTNSFHTRVQWVY